MTKTNFKTHSFRFTAQSIRTHKAFEFQFYIEKKESIE